MSLRWAESRFAEPRSFPERERFYVLFALCKKNQKAHQRFANLWTPGTIQIAGRYGVFAKMTGNHQVTGFVKSCNFAEYRRQWFESVRCSGFTAQGIRANSKRTAVFFANSRLRGVEMGGGGWKRVAWGSNKERFVQMKSFFQHTKNSNSHCTKANEQS